MTEEKPSPSELLRKAASRDRPAEEESPLPDLERDLGEHQLQYEVDALRQQLQEAQETHRLRIGYANKIFALVCVWLGCVIGAVLLAGFQTFGFALSDKVLMTFIASTTVPVLGLFVIVAKWMFKHFR